MKALFLALKKDIKKGGYSYKIYGRGLKVFSKAHSFQ